ncbi:MAG: hypothetical protein GXO08_03865 [Aquificae bacterium]|nr:hypothetical protein [Aquificota bacterium]
MEKKDALLIGLSLLAFLSIFGVQYYGSKVVSEKKEQIKRLDAQIRKENAKIARLKRQIKNLNESFKDFYVEGLKEKVFAVWYRRWWDRRVLPQLVDLKSAFDGLTPFFGLWVYPNPLKFGKGRLLTFGVKNAVVFEPVKTNPFLSPETLPAVTVPNFFVAVDEKKTEERFERALSKIDDAEVRSNLRLEYYLLKNPLEDFEVRSAALVLIPVNFASAHGDEARRELFNRLKERCSLLIVNAYYREGKYFKGWSYGELVDAVCVKYVF